MARDVLQHMDVRHCRCTTLTSSHSTPWVDGCRLLFPSQDAIKLFVGNIPKQCTEDYLLPFFETIGKVVELVIVRDKITHESKGSAFVWYASRTNAERAILQLNLRHVLHDPSGEQDRPLVVRKAKARAAKHAPGAPAMAPAGAALAHPSVSMLTGAPGLGTAPGIASAAPLGPGAAALGAPGTPLFSPSSSTALSAGGGLIGSLIGSGATSNMAQLSQAVQPRAAVGSSSMVAPPQAAEVEALPVTTLPAAAAQPAAVPSPSVTARSTGMAAAPTTMAAFPAAGGAAGAVYTPGGPAFARTALQPMPAGPQVVSIPSAPGVPESPGLAFDPYGVWGGWMQGR